MITLIIKGNMFDAHNAAYDHGVTLFSSAQPFDGRQEVVASVKSEARDAVVRWFVEDCNGSAPYPAGSLLFYSEKPDDV